MLIEYIDEEHSQAPNFLGETGSNYFLASNDLNLMDKSQTSLEEYLPNLHRSGSCNLYAEKEDRKEHV